jgi:hypothetical protein
LEARYIFMASMDVAPDKEAVFDEVYDTEHVPCLSRVPGVLSIARFRTGELKMAIGGEIKTVVLEDQPRHTAIYELESPDVLVSDEWAAAVETGRWPTDVRPHTTNRRHTLLHRSGL